MLVPDIFVYCESLPEDDTQRFKGIPKLVIEILSPSTAFYDTTRKMQIYEQMGVMEYWIVSPTAQILTVYNFKEETRIDFWHDDIVTSKVLDGFKVVGREIFN